MLVRQCPRSDLSIRTRRSQSGAERLDLSEMHRGARTDHRGALLPLRREADLQAHHLELIGQVQGEQRLVRCVDCPASAFASQNPIVPVSSIRSGPRMPQAAIPTTAETVSLRSQFLRVARRIPRPPALSFPRQCVAQRPGLNLPRRSLTGMRFTAHPPRRGAATRTIASARRRVDGNLGPVARGQAIRPVRRGLFVGRPDLGEGYAPFVLHTNLQHVHP